MIRLLCPLNSPPAPLPPFPLPLLHFHHFFAIPPTSELASISVSLHLPLQVSPRLILCPLHVLPFQWGFSNSLIYSCNTSPFCLYHDFPFINFLHCTSHLLIKYIFGLSSHLSLSSLLLWSPLPKRARSFVCCVLYFISYG